MKKARQRSRRKQPNKLLKAISHADHHAGEPGDHLLVLADVIVGVLLVAALLISRSGLERNGAFQLLQQSSFDVLQHFLSYGPAPDISQIAVVDITEIPMSGLPGQRKYDFTNRPELQGLIDKIAAEVPRAIGLDTDFTPYPNQRAQDIAFLSHCLGLVHPRPDSHRKPVPVFVGVAESVLLGPDLCLADPRFRDLAAFVGFPNVEESKSRMSIVGWLRVRYQQDDSAETREWICPSLAAAVTQHRTPPPVTWISKIVRSIDPFDFGDYADKTFTIDYGPLETLEDSTISAMDIDHLDSNYFHDKYVFIGRGKLSHDTGDRYPIPGRRGDAHAGVYVHACAAYTLLRGVLFTPTKPGSLLLDVIVALPVILIVAGIRVRYRRLEHHAVMGFVTLLAALMVLVVAFVMVSFTRVLWDDFVVVAVSLLLHQSIESTIEPLTERLAHALPKSWNS